MDHHGEGRVRFPSVRVHRRTGRLLALAAALPVLVAGCGGTDDSVTPRDAPAQSGGTVSTNLTIVVDDGNGETTTWQLTCDPPGGTHPDPAAACAALSKSGQKSMAPVAKDQMCTQIYGGPQTAKITGTWNGEEVDATFSRTNGCEISRWSSMAGLLPDVASDLPQ